MNRLIAIGLLFLFFLVQGCVSSYSDNRPQLDNEAISLLTEMAALIDEGLRRNFIKPEELHLLNTAVQKFISAVTYDRAAFMEIVQQRTIQLQKLSYEEIAPYFIDFHKELPGIIRRFEADTQLAIQHTQRNIANNHQNSSFNEGTSNLGSEPLSMYNPNFNYNIGPTPVVNFGSPSINPNPTTNFLINTDSGFQQIRCRTLSNGFVYCD